MQTESTPLIEAKQEYMAQLQQLIDKAVFAKFYGIFEKVVEDTEDPDQVLVQFQTEMEGIRLWNADTVAEVTKQVVCDEEFFSQLLTAVLILKTKIMTAFKIDSAQKNVQLKVPSNEHFVHHLCTVTGHHLYNNPWVFVPDESKHVSTRRYRDCLEIIHASIDETVTNFVPVRNILREYIGMKEPVGISTPTVPDPEPEPEPEPELVPEPETKVFDATGTFLPPAAAAAAMAHVSTPPMALSPPVAPIVPPNQDVHYTGDIPDSAVLDPSDRPAFEDGIGNSPALDLPSTQTEQSSHHDTFDSDSSSSEDSSDEFEPSDRTVQHHSVVA